MKKAATQEQINVDIVQWGLDTGILDLGTPEKQLEVLEREVAEVREAAFNMTEIVRLGCNTDKAITELALEIGDVYVSLLLYAVLQGVDLRYCSKLAQNKIQKRVQGGKMRDGVFVKESDL